MNDQVSLKAAFGFNGLKNPNQVLRRDAQSVESRCKIADGGLLRDQVESSPGFSGGDSRSRTELLPKEEDYRRISPIFTVKNKRLRVYPK